MHKKTQNLNRLSPSKAMLHTTDQTVFRQAKQQVLNEDLMLADAVMNATVASNQPDQRQDSSVKKSPSGHL